MAKAASPSNSPPKRRARTAEPSRPKQTSSRAFGRSLADFLPLFEAERDLLECCRFGRTAMLADVLPTKKTDKNHVRADFIRFLALGGEVKAPVHEHGLMLAGAWISGPLALDGVTLERPLLFWRCRLERIEAQSAKMKSLSLDGCRVENGIQADRLQCEGSVHLRAGFHLTGEARLLGARIGSNFECNGARFENEGADVLSFDGATIGGGVFLRHGFRAKGEVRFLLTAIGADLDCLGGSFENPDGDALSFDGATIGGNIFLNKGFQANGQVRLTGVTAKGNLECRGGSFTKKSAATAALNCDRTRFAGSVYLAAGFRSVGGVNLDGAEIGGNLNCLEGSFKNEASSALSAHHTQVKGSFYLQDVNAMEGGVNLPSMHVGALCDDLASWQHSKDQISLDGFTYDRLASGAPTNAEDRIAWLCMQQPTDLAETFRPQPWEHLIATLRQMGLPDEARSVAVAKHERMRRAGRYVGGSRLWDWLYGNLVGYGYRPWKLLRITGAVWLACTLAYWPAANPSAFGLGTHLLGPAQSQPDLDCIVSRASSRSPAPCPRRKPNYDELFLPAFSADVLLPVIAFGDTSDWRPIVSSEKGESLPWGWVIRGVYWFEIVFGWLASLLLIAAVGNLVKRE